MGGDVIIPFESISLPSLSVSTLLWLLDMLSEGEMYERCCLVRDEIIQKIPGSEPGKDSSFQTQLL